MPGGGGRVKRFSRLLLSGQPPHVHGPSAGGKQVEYSRIFLFPKVVSPSGNSRGIPHPTPCREPARNHHPLPFPRERSPQQPVPLSPPVPKAIAHASTAWSVIGDAVAIRPGPRETGDRPFPTPSFGIPGPGGQGLPALPLHAHGESRVFRLTTPFRGMGFPCARRGRGCPIPPKNNARLGAVRAGTDLQTAPFGGFRFLSFCAKVAACMHLLADAPQAKQGGAASCRALADGGREGKKTNRAKADKIAAGKREVEIHKTVPNAAPRTRIPGRGVESTLKTMKTASRTWKGGRRADGKGLSDNSNNSRQWFWRQLGQPETTLARCRADNPARRKVANVTREGRKVSESRRDTENFLFGVPTLSACYRYRAGLWRPL